MFKPEIISSADLKNILKNKKTALVCTKYWGKNNFLEKYLSINSSSFHQIVLIPSGEPESDSLDKISQGLDSGIEEIVALGGGSSIDSAKMLGILKNSNSRCADYEFAKKVIPNDVISIIAVPTTAGSGSEATMYTVINNSQTRRKFTLTDYSLMPNRVLLCPELTMALPEKITISAGMDAFIQSFESFFSKKPNIISSSLAPLVMSIILRNLPSIIQSPHDLQARKMMQEASFLSGICINYSRTGLIHTISAALSKYFSNPHGELNTIIMPHVIEFNKEHHNPPKDQLEFLLKSLDLKSLDSFLDYIISFCRKFNLNIDTKVIVDKKEIIKRIFQDSDLSSVNPQEIDEEKLLKLIERILG